MDSLNSQTKCNTLGVVMGKRYHVTIEERLKWPVYEPRDKVSAKSQQVWIAAIDSC